MNQISNRKGVTATEVLVAAVMLMTVMTFVTTLAVKIGLVWKDVNHRRVAICELANQLETLTLLSPKQAEKAIADLKASATCARTLQAPELKGVLEEDELGTRITLSINWKRRTPIKPVQLSGWIVEAKPVEEKSEAAPTINENKENDQSTAEADLPPVPRSPVKNAKQTSSELEKEESK